MLKSKGTYVEPLLCPLHWAKGDSEENNNSLFASKGHNIPSEEVRYTLGERERTTLMAVHSIWGI